jgi:SAM-dependent methyltransferase
MEVRLPKPFEDTITEFYAGQPHRDHLASDYHLPRLMAAKEMIEWTRPTTWIDYGCGDGGLLDLIFVDHKLGFDLAGANLDYAASLDRPVIEADITTMEHPYCDVASACEVLEHLPDPHGFLASLHCRYLVCTVPSVETPEQHDYQHLWVWDEEGFKAMVEGAGYVVVECRRADPAWVILAVRKP